VAECAEEIYTRRESGGSAPAWYGISGLFSYYYSFQLSLL
jgi:hypothetical protein